MGNLLINFATAEGTIQRGLTVINVLGMALVMDVASDALLDKSAIEHEY